MVPISKLFLNMTLPPWLVCPISFVNWCNTKTTWWFPPSHQPESSFVLSSTSHWSSVSGPLLDVPHGHLLHKPLIFLFRSSLALLHRKSCCYGRLDEARRNTVVVDGRFLCQHMRVRSWWWVRLDSRDIVRTDEASISFKFALRRYKR
jgi:hypothetical protein